MHTDVVQLTATIVAHAHMRCATVLCSYAEFAVVRRNVTCTDTVVKQVIHISVLCLIYVKWHNLLTLAHLCTAVCHIITAVWADHNLCNESEALQLRNISQSNKDGDEMTVKLFHDLLLSPISQHSVWSDNLLLLKCGQA